MLKLLTYFTLLYTICVNVVYAENSTPSDKVEELTIKSQFFDTPINFNVTLPQSYENGKDKKYFVLFDLHPRSQPYLSGMHNWLSHNGEWPWLETIIVTPKAYHDGLAKLFEKTVAEPTSSQMLDFLQLEVMASVDNKYRTNGYKIYSGFMSNGAIGMYVLLNRPDTFNAYMITSPTLSDNFLSISTDVNTKIKTESDKQRFLYLATGKHAYEKSHLAGFEQLTTDLKSNAPNTLKWHSTIDNHYYMSRPIMTVLNGIELLFDDIHHDLPFDSEISKGGVDAIIDYYQALSKYKYGYAISAEGSLKNLAKSKLDSAPELALTIYKRVVALYPDSAYAHSALANAYGTVGQLDNAISAQKLAVEHSKSMVKWHQNKHKTLLEEYLKKKVK